MCTVCVGHLSHGCKEALWVEEACHPEAVGTSLEDPGLKLTVSLQKLGEPEAKSTGGPGGLKQTQAQAH